ncbi:hypothetical protein SESBI_40261 [Sesbania bispinosa]|nr:hypothetical protein SESBI_40261 [Sesbania bispinosa]
MASVTSVNDDSKMVGELVKQVGHVASDAEGKEVRKSSRKRMKSVKLRDYIQ